MSPFVQSYPLGIVATVCFQPLELEVKQLMEKAKKADTGKKKKAPPSSWPDRAFSSWQLAGNEN